MLKSHGPHDMDSIQDKPPPHCHECIFYVSSQQAVVEVGHQGQSWLLVSTSKIKTLSLGNERCANNTRIFHVCMFRICMSASVLKAKCDNPTSDCVLMLSECKHASILFAKIKMFDQSLSYVRAN